MLRPAVIAGVLAASLAPASAAAQAASEPRTAVGLGVALSGIRAAAATDPDGAVTVRVERRWTHRLSWGVEAGTWGLRDEEPRVGDLTTDASGQDIVVHRRPRIVNTRTVLGFVGVEVSPDVFVRAGGGLGGHAYPIYGRFPELDSAEVSREWGLVVAASAGRQWRPARRVAIAIEGFFLWSSGEDSTSSRQLFGVQVVPRLRF
jgi:hypothetical protein